MKNLKKLLGGLFTLLVVFTCIAPVSAAEAPKSFIVKREAVMESYIGDNNGFTSYVTTDGTIVYCMDLDMKGATSGTNYTYSTNADAGLLYIMENGYPNKSITNRDEIDRYITQSAVWWYLSDTGQTAQMNTAFQTTDKEAYPGIRDHIKTLVNGAKNASQTSTTIEVSTTNTNLSLTDDEKYYESNAISVNLSGADTYSISVTGGTNGTIVTDENGTAKSEFNVGENFKIRVPSSELTSATNLTVTVSAAGGKSAAVYAPSDSSFQRVVSSEVYTTDVTDNLTLNVTPSEDTPGIEVSVPNTSANIPFIILGVGFALVLVGFGIFAYVTKKKAKTAKK